MQLARERDELVKVQALIRSETGALRATLEEILAQRMRVGCRWVVASYTQHRGRIIATAFWR